MPNYAKMYRTLFRSQTRAIAILTKAQQITEEIYVNSSLTAPKTKKLHRLKHKDANKAPEEQNNK